MPIILDCEDGESALASLSDCFNLTPGKLSDILRSIDVQSYYISWENSPDVDHTEFLYNYVVEEAGHPNNTDYICYFHTTRTTEANNFYSGILPLCDVIEVIWQTLCNIFVGTNIERNLLDMKNNGFENFHYNNKIDKESAYGPFAILVREIADDPERLSQHNYFRMPEIIEDICDGYYTAFGEPIYNQVHDALHPCVVKFSKAMAADQGCIEAALYYAYTYVNSLPVSGGSVWCFDGENQPVTYDEIIYIDFIEE